MRSIAPWLVAAVFFAVPLMGDLRAAGDPAKELAALENDFETSPLAWTESYPAFRPKYEAFATKYPGTEQALTAKLRLLEFTGAIRDDEAAMHAAAGKCVDGILSEFPRSEQLEKLPSMWYLFDQAKFAGVMKALADPAQPDRVKAAVLLHDGTALMGNKRTDEGAAKLTEILTKYKDVPYRYSTYGEVADAKLNPHDPATLAIGKAAPEIVGKTMDGKPVKLSDFKGRVVVIDFFGDW